MENSRTCGHGSLEEGMESMDGNGHFDMVWYIRTESKEARNWLSKGISGLARRLVRAALTYGHSDTHLVSPPGINRTGSDGIVVRAVVISLLAQLSRRLRLCVVFGVLCPRDVSADAAIRLLRPARTHARTHARTQESELRNGTAPSCIAARRGVKSRR